MLPLISNLISSIPTVVTTIATAFKTAVPAIATFVTTYGPTILKAVNVVSSVIEMLSKTFNILNQDETTKEIGLKALYANDQGISQNSFDTYKEYLAEIRKIDLKDINPNQYSDDEQMLTGIAAVNLAIEEQMQLSPGTMGVLSALAAITPSYFSGPRILSLLDTKDSIYKVIDYFQNGSLSISERQKVEEQLIAIDKKNNPDSFNHVESLKQIDEAYKSINK